MVLFTYKDYLKYANPISFEIREEYIEKLNKGGKDNMEFEKFLIEWLQDEKKESEKLGIAKIIKEMIKNNISDKQIMKIAKIDKNELEKLKTA